VRTLWVLRHAKAVAHSPADHGRNLAARGRRQTVELSAYLAGLDGAKPGLVLTSSAARALQTAERVIDSLGTGVEMTVDPELYQADPDEVMARLRQVDDAQAQVMVVGHNPTLLELVLELLDPDDGAGRQHLDRGLPTGALAVVAFDVIGWAQLSSGEGRLVDFYAPKAR
jgi:phosphohistidine phosphatase